MAEGTRAFGQFEHYQALNDLLHCSLPPVHSPWLLGALLSVLRQYLPYRGTHFYSRKSVFSHPIYLPTVSRPITKVSLHLQRGPKKSNQREKGLHTKRMAVSYQLIKLHKFNKFHWSITNLENWCGNGFFKQQKKNKIKTKRTKTVEINICIKCNQCQNPYSMEEEFRVLI